VDTVTKPVNVYGLSAFLQKELHSFVINLPLCIAKIFAQEYFFSKCSQTATQFVRNITLVI